MSVTKADVLDEAKATVAGRGKSYGAPEDNFDRIARRWTVHMRNRYGDQGVVFDAQDVSMMMIDLKLARLENDPAHADSWVDVAGYAACGGELAARK